MTKHTISFKHAFSGIFYFFRTQPNFRIHLLATIVVLIAAFYFQVTRSEWLILLLTITMVLVAEMLNTAVESMTDLITIKRHKHAKIAKDVAAGMVLSTAILSILVGLVIFAPYLSTSFRI